MVFHRGGLQRLLHQERCAGVDDILFQCPSGGLEGRGGGLPARLFHDIALGID